MPVPPGSTAPPLARDRFLVASAAFSTPEHGFVLGAACHDTCTTRLLVTMDGGRTWTARASLPVDLTPTTDIEALTAQSQLLAADEQHLLVVSTDGRGFQATASSDGGRTFSPLALTSSPMHSLRASADVGGFWLLPATGPDLDHPIGRLARLTLKSRLIDLGPISPGLLAAAADATWLVQDQDETSVTELTKDGVRHERGRAPCSGRLVTDGERLLEACQKGAAAGSSFVQVFASSDFGRTWTARTAPRLMASTGGLVSARGDRWVLSNSLGPSPVRISDDAGSSWRPASTSLGVDPGGSYPAISDGQHGVLVAGDPATYGRVNQTPDGAAALRDFGVWMTSDGGDSWRHVAVPLPAG